MLRAVREEGFNRLYREKLAIFEQMRGNPFGYLPDGSYAYVRYVDLFCRHQLISYSQRYCMNSE